VWDAFTPVEEVVRALDDAVSAGKVLYVGISDTRAWLLSQAVTLADLRGWTRFAGLQVPYSLVWRDVERDLLPMAQALDLAVTTWAHLARACSADATEAIEPDPRAPGSPPPSSAPRC
jgi:aryl-alcohol dehydrogenase-like predicted oxidoreductase